MPFQRMITLTTDFGLTEHYVGAMKGVIHSINPPAQVVDITNAVQSFDVLDGALAVSQAYHYFPKDTVHVVVVDPGVGGPRRPIIATIGQYLFVAPDNGVLSLVYEREERVSVRHITSEHYFHHPVSKTFHGRDIFAPVAAYLSKGVDTAKFGEEITDYVRFLAPTPKATAENSWKGLVLKTDKFGKLITIGQYGGTDQIGISRCWAHHACLSWLRVVVDSQSSRAWRRYHRRARGRTKQMDSRSG